MQINPDPVDFPLTPRLEVWENETWFTQLHDLQAKIVVSDQKGIVQFIVDTQLLSEAQSSPPVAAQSTN